MLQLIVAWTVAAANVIAAAYIAVLTYTQIKNWVRTGEIKFYYGIGPVLIPIDIGGGKPGTTTGAGGVCGVRVRSVDEEGGDIDATS